MAFTSSTLNRTGATQECIITVVIDDSFGATLSQDYSQSVQHEPIAPTVELKVASSTILYTVGLVAEANDEDGTIEVYQWVFDGDGVIDATSTSPSISFTYDTLGTYDISVIAVDNDGQTAVATVVFTVSSPPNPGFTPTATTTGDAPLTVQFTDTSTGSPTSWLWNFGDGATSTAQHSQHTYNRGRPVHRQPHCLQRLRVERGHQVRPGQRDRPREQDRVRLSPRRQRRDIRYERRRLRTAQA